MLNPKRPRPGVALRDHPLWPVLQQLVDLVNALSSESEPAFNSVGLRTVLLSKAPTPDGSNDRFDLLLDLKAMHRYGIIGGKNCWNIRNTLHRSGDNSYLIVRYDSIDRAVQVLQQVLDAADEHRALVQSMKEPGL